jgi:hypothetical protein
LQPPHKNAINPYVRLNHAEGNALSALLSLASEEVPLMTLIDTVLELFERRASRIRLSASRHA